MRMKSAFIPTLRQVPGDAEVISHQLMLRAGMIRKVAAGVYTLLPMGNMVIKKIENIVREEMNRQDAQELLMPTLCPAELWQESGRWEFYGPELMRIKDRHDRDFCLGPTHEEVITDLVRREINSYRDLPINLYQIQTKFRDEIRPRFGLMRGREFIMKDAYSFDADQAGLDENYRKMHEAYCRIFERCGLEYRAVEADSGSIGGSSSHEFMVLAETGEDFVAYCPKCSYGANVEKAEFVPAIEDKAAEDMQVMGEVHTPDSHTIEEVSAFLKTAPNKIIKTLIANTENETVVVLVRGDRELNEPALKRVLGCEHLTLAGPETVIKVTGADVGFAGPVGIAGYKIIADEEVMRLQNAVCGANKTDFHLTGVNPGRDFEAVIVGSFRVVVEGDGCPKCGEAMSIVKGIEVGHIFKLGTKYSVSMNATFTDEKGEPKPFIMGCYGIGVGRTMASAIEQNHDDKGIIWPMPIAPFHAHIIPVKVTDPAQMDCAEKLYRELQDAGLDVMIDDRDERAGVKFNDADLIGSPIRVTIGAKTLERGCVEFKLRNSDVVEEIPVSEITAKVITAYKESI